MVVSSIRAACLVVAGAGCYAPSAAPGLPCSEALGCPANQRCDVDAAGGPTCVALGAAAPDASDAPPPIVDAPDPTIATTDGPIVGPVNDLPAAAIDVSAGGTFAFELATAHDDLAIPCAGGGPEVFYRITLAAPEVIYVDTFGSSANVAVAIRAGGCTMPGPAEGCVDDSCGGAQVQAAWNLDAGDHCLVVENSGGAGTTGQLVVVRGNRAGDPLPGATGTVTGDTCQDDDSNTAVCGCEPAQDHHYFFTVCPATTVSAHVETCTGAAWDTVLQLRDNANTSRGCTDDSCGTFQSTLTRSITGPGLFWAIIDGCNACGPYTLAYGF